MKKLSEFSMKETRQFIITLKAELKTIISDSDLKDALKAFADAKKGKETNITPLDMIFTVIDSLLVTNEQAFWTILAAFAQSTVEEVQEMNNVEAVRMVADFLSIDTYKKSLSLAIESATNVA